MRTPLRIGALALVLVTTCAVALFARQGPARSAAAPMKAAIKMPPLDTTGYALARPLALTKTVYEFVATHPEVSRYVPCYCGCEADGHKANESCFIGARDTAGNVTRWDTHGFGCAICLDVGRESMQLYNSGADPAAIRAAIERKWGPQHRTRTPTPPVPAKKP